MKLSELQVLIPGWNIYYLIKERRKRNAEIQKMMDDHNEFIASGQEDRKIVALYAKRRDEAKKHGDLKTAKEFDRKIYDMAIKYINNI